MELAKGKSGWQKGVIWTFAVVSAGLFWMARRMHLTYNAINVLVYYWLIPASWTMMIDWRVDWQVATPWGEGFCPLLTLLLCAAWVGILLATVRFFGKWCDLMFNTSVDFLNYFNRWGGNYVLNSVVVCVCVPVAIYILLAVL